MMRWKVLPLVCGMLGLATAATVTAEDGAAAQAAFRVVNATVDAGDVIAGSVGVATFEFRNDSDKEVQIVRAAPS